MPGRAHELAVVARVAARNLLRRARQEDAPPPSHAEFRQALEPWLGTVPSETLAAAQVFFLPANQLPWFDTGIELKAGDSVTVLAEGRVHLSRLLGIWVDPSFQLWYRVGDQGPVFRGTRGTHSFTAERPGRLWLASYFPGEWADPSGGLRPDTRDYSGVSGGMSVAVLRWQAGIRAADAVPRLAAVPGAPALVRAEYERLSRAVAPPEGWSHLWYLGDSEIYAPATAPDGRPAIRCRTHREVGILRRDSEFPLVPGLRLQWSWKVERLPSEIAEDTLPTHDYLSLAVEFDDGQDLTYYWSAALPVGTVYRCCLPTWRDKETHVVVRSGTEGLGRWMDEERNLYEDYARIIGGRARRVLRTWLIANSLFQRGEGRCEYAGITLAGDGRALRIL